MKISIHHIARLVEIVNDVAMVCVFYGTETEVHRPKIDGGLVFGFIMLCLYALDIHKKYCLLVVCYNIIWCFFYATAGTIALSYWIDIKYYSYYRMAGGFTVGGLCIANAAVLIINCLLLLIR
ncbi:hypothetical protein Anas_02624 [Armadillidium nasatum]|uniref:Transmembrane protein n=1 Tax=Armadillidium nasatum TaxID=96803 RepID=A0A5N5TFB8_9CRUS|nr:hypothetical protein Anas_02624 [Armadillidium nasatum]